MILVYVLSLLKFYNPNLHNIARSEQGSRRKTRVKGIKMGKVPLLYPVHGEVMLYTQCVT